MRPSDGGGSTVVFYELAPEEEVVVTVRLSHYVSIESPGRYQMRFAFRMDGFWELDEEAKDLPCGVLFLYSEPFVIDATASEGG